jgi:hypothetical protein
LNTSTHEEKIIMQRKLLWLLCCVALTVTTIFAQEDEEEPVPPRKHAASKLGGAAGFTQNLLYLNLDPINDVLGRNLAAPFDKGPMVLLGAQGYGYILVLQNVRVGGMGGSGTMRSTSVDLATKTTRNVDLSAGFGGVTFDYVIPIVPRLDLSVGTLIGWGGMSIKMTRDQGTPKVWDGLWADFGRGQSVTEYSRMLSGSFFIYQPQANLEFALLRWLGLRVGVGYMGTLGNSWKLDDTYELLSVPSNINSRGVMINGGLFLGTFIF